MNTETRSLTLSTFSLQAPNPCFNWNGQNMICCPGSCGPNGGPLATCAGSPATTPAPPVTSAPETSPPATSPPVTPPQQTSPPETSPPLTSPPVTSSPETAPPVTSPPVTSPPETSPPATSPPVTPPGTNLPPAPAGYQWVANPGLSDEFNGDSLDRSKWQPIIPYYSGRLPSQYSTANVAVGGGYARLTSTTAVNDVSQVANPFSDPWISAAALASTGAYAGLGYYEARMKASDILMTSSFWFQSQHTETDVIETIGDPNNFRSRYMPINTHYYPNGVSEAPDQSTPFFYRLPDGVLTSGDFHTYGLWWQDAQTLHFYFDGQLATTITPAGPFTESQYLFFDTEVFSQYGLPSVADLKDPSKNVFLIDYVRAFYLVPNGK
ncbi:Concanavalin A-like lectin/glucanase [Klebsormidium nitens]|uniref:Concanavalin A-like lectin/glucanase n=1 Tax=Klebsormidium nitens TaxID=105231 RepID=A0A1Y1HZY1_KLENI|nr:Concanavalin A-like lectin/glucanase [Klebsormidium nitens]|eukprot:GAQ84215.1 Concanavalin A-like lectin/glucanase [Klebsormidium nitens]